MYNELRELMHNEHANIQILHAHGKKEEKLFGDYGFAAKARDVNHTAMRVLCEAPNGTEIEGVVIYSDGVDDTTGEYLLDGVFTVQCDDGKRVQVRGWLVSTRVFPDVGN